MVLLLVMIKGHYGADNLMLKDINDHLINSELSDSCL